MATSAPLTFSPHIEPTIPRDIQRHFQLIYSTLNNHALAFQSLPKSTGVQPITVQTFSPKIDDSIPRDVQRHLQLIYKGINNHGIAFTQLPKLKSAAKPEAVHAPQVFDAHIERTIPPLVQLHLQLIYSKLDNHAQAFAYYKANMPAVKP